MFSNQHSRRVKGIWKQERMGRAKGRVREKHTLSPRDRAPTSCANVHFMHPGCQRRLEI